VNGKNSWFSDRFQVLIKWFISFFLRISLLILHCTIKQPRRFKMRKVLFLGLAASCMLSTAQAGNGDNPKRLPLLKPVPYVSTAQKLERARSEEAKANAASPTTKPVTFSNNKRSGGSNSIQATSVVISDLGTSINPFTVISGGRNCVGVAPAINTVAFFRRGGDADPAGTTGRPGNKLLYDLNTKGGAEGFWQISKGPLFLYLPLMILISTISLFFNLFLINKA
jgi:hypothetical protein